MLKIITTVCTVLTFTICAFLLNSLTPRTTHAISTVEYAIGLALIEDAANAGDLAFAGGVGNAFGLLVTRAENDMNEASLCNSQADWQCELAAVAAAIGKMRSARAIGARTASVTDPLDSALGIAEQGKTDAIDNITGGP